MDTRANTSDVRESPVILEMRSITKEFPGVKALSDVSLEVRADEIHAICGENGAGKSTLMKVVSGVYPTGTYDGQFFFKGEECHFHNIRESEQKGIVIIHQELALVPHLSITENIFLANEQATRGVINWSKSHAKAIELLKKVGLHETPDTKISHLGVGKQQLVEIAKALSKNVELLILDEPTSSLNENDSQALLQLLREFRSNGIACVLISHKLKEVESVADTITVLRDGAVIESLDATTGVTAFSPRPTRRRSSSAAWFVSFQLIHPRLLRSLPRKMFSAIERFAASASSWWMMTMPRASLSRMPEKWQASPSKVISPS